MIFVWIRSHGIHHHFFTIHLGSLIFFSIFFFFQASYANQSLLFLANGFFLPHFSVTFTYFGLGVDEHKNFWGPKPSRASKKQYIKLGGKGLLYSRYTWRVYN